MSRFQPCLTHVLGHEGGKSDNPKDPGGRTYQGVTNRTFKNWLASVGKPPRDVYTMTNEERDSIYRQLYWNVIWGDKLPAGVDLAMFDGAVNSGPMQAIKWLQRSLGAGYKGKIDGVMGNLTIQAVLDFPDKVKLVNSICDRRLAFLESLSTFAVFGKGWAKRVSSVRAASVMAVKRGLIPSSTGQIVANSQAKGLIEDAKPIPGMSPADSTSATGISSGMIGLALNQAKEAIEPYASGSNVLGTIVVVLVLSGLALTVGGFVWRIINGNRRAKLVDDLNLVEENVHA